MTDGRQNANNNRAGMALLEKRLREENLYAGEGSSKRNIGKVTTVLVALALTGFVTYNLHKGIEKGSLTSNLRDGYRMLTHQPLEKKAGEFEDTIPKLSTSTPYENPIALLEDTNYEAPTNTKYSEQNGITSGDNVIPLKRSHLIR